MLLLQEFDFDIQHRLGLQHAVGDYLSDLKLGELAETEYDEIPDASLFCLGIATLLVDSEDNWIMGMTQFLNTSLPPDHLTLDGKKRLAVQSRNFCLITNTPYHKGSDGIWRHIVR